jgi:hypothetical protein
VVNFLASPYFNRLSAQEYLKSAACLDVSYVIRNEIWQNGENLLKAELFEELSNKGFTQDDLLAVSHTYVAIR